MNEPEEAARPSENADYGNLPEEISKIKGDAIGDTLYSERWVLRTLIKLSELTAENWCSDLEQDVCLLWDMTAEKDVVLFLHRNGFFDLFTKVIRVTNDARCIEMMVGIVANMTCVEEVRPSLANHEASSTLVNLITSEDSLILVQLLRLLNTCLWRERVDDGISVTSPPQSRDASPRRTAEDLEEASPWLRVIIPHKDLFLQHLGFFFSSAINEELLCSSLDLLDTLLKIPALSLFSATAPSAELAAGLVECLRQLLRGAKVGDSLTANKRLWRGCEVWLSIVGVLASCQEGRLNLGAQGDVLTKCFTKLLLLLTTPEALKTQDPEMAVLCLCVLETIPVCPVSPPVLARLVAVLTDLDSVSDSLSQNTEDCLQVSQLLYRASNFLRLRIEESDDVAALVRTLSPSEVDYLQQVVSVDSSLREKLDRSILQIRTNGLVQ